MTPEEKDALAQCYDLLGQIEAFRELGEPFPYLEIYHGGFIAIRDLPDLQAGGPDWGTEEGVAVKWRGWQEAAQGVGQVLVTLQADHEQAKKGGVSPLTRLWLAYNAYSKAKSRAGQAVYNLSLNPNGAGALVDEENDAIVQWGTFEEGISLLETLRKGMNP